MNEAYFRDKLSAYLDNELPPDERAMMEQYLVEHPEAQTQLEELKKLNSLIASQSGMRDDLYWEKAARKVEDRLGISDAASDRTAAPKRGWSPLRWTSAVAAAASILLIAYVTFRDDGQIEQAVDQKMDAGKEAKPTLPLKLPEDSLSEIIPPPSSVMKKPAEEKQAEPTILPRPEKPPVKEEQARKAAEAAPNDIPVEAGRQAVTSSEMQDEESSIGLSVPEPTAVPVQKTMNSLTETAEQQAETNVDQLAALRRQRDSLLAPQKPKLGVGVTGLASGDKKGVLFDPRSKDQQTDRTKLLDIWFQIAKVTPDSTERRQTVDSLRVYARSENRQLRDLASQYLDSLSAGTPGAAE